MAWRVAGALNQLLLQLNQLAPNRSKESDGSIGDAAHSARDSDHNPDGAGVVRARDFTHDPGGGLDCHWLARVLTTGGDRRVKYVIWNSRIWQDGTWRNYTGSNAHTKHLHLSVVAGAAGDSAAPWNLGGDDFLMGLSQADQDLLVKAAQRTMGMLQQTYWKPVKDSTRIEVVPAGTAGAIPSGVLDTVAGNYLVNQVWELRAQLVRQEALMKQMQGDTVDQQELEQTLQDAFDEFVEEWRTAAAAGAETEEVKR